MSLTGIYRNYRIFRFIYSCFYYIKWRIFHNPNSATPHILKKKIIGNLQKNYNLDTLVETGTYLGDMIFAQKNNFKSIHSIELSEQLFSIAKKRFSKYPHINLYLGDSSTMLEKVLQNINSPALFWLDAHYSAGITAKSSSSSAVTGELNSILKNALNHIILIDDARCFNGSDGYPSIDEINEILQKYDCKYNLSIQNDIIFLLPE